MTTTIAIPIAEDPKADWFQDASPSQQSVLRALTRISHFEDLDTRAASESLHQCAQASFLDYEVVPGTYRIALEDLGDLGGYDCPKERARIESLAHAIKENGEIEPLFVALDQEGYWLVEGQHRARALKLLGYDGVPARLIVDLDDVPELVLAQDPAPAVSKPHDAFQTWFGKSTVVDAAGEPMVMHRGSPNPNAEAYNADAMVFLTASETFAAHYGKGGKVHHFHVRCEKPFDASRGAGHALWKQFEQETGAQSWAMQGTDRGALPYWTQEHLLRTWLDAKGVDYDGIWFGESNHTASLAVRSLDQVQDMALRHVTAPMAPASAEKANESIGAQAVKALQFLSNLDAVQTAPRP